MSNTITIHFQNGTKTFAIVNDDEADGWEHMLQTTAQGERLTDTEFVSLRWQSGLTEYVRTRDVLRVAITP